MFVSLKPLAERKISADQVIARLRRELAVVPGATLFLQAVQDIRVGGRQSNAQYQYTLQGDSFDELDEWAPKLDRRAADRAQAHRRQQRPAEQGPGSGRRHRPRYAPRASASRSSQIDNTLYDAFGQRQVSTIYVARNQYHVIMEVAPQYWQNPETLKQVYRQHLGRIRRRIAGDQRGGRHLRLRRDRPAPPPPVAADAARNQATNSISSTGKVAASTGSAVSTSLETMVPLSAVAHYGPGSTPLAVNHQGLFVATTISFNLAPGVALSEAVAAIDAADGPHRHARLDPRQLPGHGARLPGIAVRPAAADPGRAHRRLRRARHSLRKLRPSA